MPLEGHTILLAEDEPLILHDLQHALEEAHASVVPADSVDRALELLDTQAITASILDFKLRGGTADDLCQQLTQRNIPFVIYSGYRDIEGDCARGEIIAKPVDPRELINSILEVLVANPSRLC